MYLFRRAAFRALQSQPTSLVLGSRSITTSTRVTLLPSRQWAITPFQRRFASEQAEQSSAAKAVDEIAAQSPAHTESETSSTAQVQTEDVASQRTESTATEALGSFSSQASLVESTKMNQDLLQTSAASETAQATQGATTPSFEPLSAAASLPPRASYQSPPITPNSTLYVGNLYFEVSEDALQHQFTPFGPIKKTRIVYDHRGLSKGFGYVEFENTDDAAKAIQALNQSVFQGRRMAVQFHRRREPTNLIKPRQANDPSKTLFIGNMSFEMSDKDLNDLFREVRNVVDVRVAIDRRTGAPRGFAHADFIDVESAKKAREYLKGKEIYGRKLRVDFSMSSSGVKPQSD